MGWLSSRRRTRFDRCSYEAERHSLSSIRSLAASDPCGCGCVYEREKGDDDDGVDSVSLSKHNCSNNPSVWINLYGFDPRKGIRFS